MGLSIHYNGRFNKEASLSEMIEEVKDIAEVYNWNYHIFEKQFPENSIGRNSYTDKVYGISFSPPGCEPIWLTFLSNGRMSSPLNLEFFGNSEDKAERKYLYMLSTKTQYAGIDVHRIIIHLLKYLSKRYLKQFNLTDEGKYWETNDEKLLEEIFRRYDDLIDSFSTALENVPIKSGETFEEYFSRILKIIQRKKNG